jgi:hypothetical protein
MFRKAITSRKALPSVLVLIAVASCGPTESRLPEMVQQISKEKATAQRLASIIKMNRLQGVLCMPTGGRPVSQAQQDVIYGEATRRYSDAAETFNAWIDGYTTAIAIGQSADSRYAYWTSQLADAVDKSQGFSRWANSTESCQLWRASLCNRLLVPSLESPTWGTNRYSAGPFAGRELGGHSWGPSCAPL